MRRTETGRQEDSIWLPGQTAGIPTRRRRRHLPLWQMGEAGSLKIGFLGSPQVSVVSKNLRDFGESVYDAAIADCINIDTVHRHVTLVFDELQPAEALAVVARHTPDDWKVRSRLILHRPAWQ